MPMHNLERQYTLDEIDDFEWDLDLILWIEPENIIGIDYKAERTKALNDIDSNIGFLLSKILIDDYCISNERQGTSNRIEERLLEILKKAIFVAKNLYSCSPAFNVFHCKALISKKNIFPLLEIAKKAYQEANKCEKLYLAYLFFEFFDVIYCTDTILPISDKCIGIDFFKKEEQIFFEEIKSLAGLIMRSEYKAYLGNCQEEINLTNIEVLKQFSYEMIEWSRRNSLYEDYDGDKYLRYISSAKDTKDIRVVQVLMRCLVYDLTGPEEDILESLASVDYRLYYQALFELADDFLQSEDGSFSLMNQLVDHHGYNVAKVPSTKEEWRAIYDIARENLSIDNIKEILNIYHKEKIGYWGRLNYPMENDESTIYPEFYQLFQKLLKEKSHSKDKVD